MAQKKRKYSKPQIVHTEKLEAVASSCLPNPVDAAGGCGKAGGAACPLIQS